MEDVGIFGGYFCPPTSAHIDVALAVGQGIGLSLVYMVTSAQPNHRNQILSPEERHSLLVRACSQYPSLRPSRIEIDRSGPSFTIDTVRAFKVQHPDARINLIIGPEYLDPSALWFVLNWEHGQELVKECRLVTHPRGGVADLQKIKNWAALATQRGIDVIVCDCPDVDISATQVRLMVAGGKSVLGLVPDSILADVQRIFRDGTSAKKGKPRGRSRVEVLRLLRNENTPHEVIDEIINEKRAKMRKAFFDSLFLIGGLPVDMDTYKRTMARADDLFALERAAYSLTPRKGLPEDGAGDQLIMAGHETILPSWFRKPLSLLDIEIARRFMQDASNVRVFPEKLWQKIAAGSSGNSLRLPVTIWGFPGGQTFLKGAPCLSFEGVGGAISMLESSFCRYFAPISWATKARLMREVTTRDAEFGMRAALGSGITISLQLARYVGSGGKGRMTSNDLVHFMFPELTDAIGTIGHEFVSSHQSFDTTLGAAEYAAMDKYVTEMGSASLLCDLVDPLTIGLENALAVIRVHTETKSVGIRVDSGDIARQCVLYYNQMRALDIEPRTIVFEDEVTPETVKRVYDHFLSETGVDPITVLFPGAGGYWYKVHRDDVSMAFKRTATGTNPNTKFSSSKGKRSLGGYLRVWGRNDSLIIADASETIAGALPLYVKLVDKGKIVYNESLATQAARADATWGQYVRVELSPLIAQWEARFTAMRDTEVAQAKQRLRAQGWTWIDDQI